MLNGQRTNQVLFEKHFSLAKPKKINKTTERNNFKTKNINIAGWFLFDENNF